MENNWKTRNLRIHRQNAHELMEETRKFFQKFDKNVYDKMLSKMINEKKNENFSSALPASFCIFSLATQLFAIPSRILHWVVENQNIYKLSNNYDKSLLGITTIQGQIRPCVSLKQLLNVQPEIRQKKQLFIIIKGNKIWACVVDTVVNICKISTSSNANVKYHSLISATANYRDEQVSIIDDKKLFNQLDSLL